MISPLVHVRLEEERGGPWQEVEWLEWSKWPAGGGPITEAGSRRRSRSIASCRRCTFCLSPARSRNNYYQRKTSYAQNRSTTGAIF